MTQKVPLQISSFLFIASIIVNSVDGFNLYIGTDEMNRTLGISARMDYVTNGIINEYSTQFPYRVAENISQIRFTWSNPGRNSRYSLRAVSEHFDVLPVLLLPSEGIVPRKSQNFMVEYRCVGARSGQFQVLLHFNISLRPPLHFTLKQEKICSYIDRTSYKEDFSSSSSDGGPVENSIVAQILQLPLLCQFLAGFVVVLLLLCSLLLCCCYCLRVEDSKAQTASEAMAQSAFRRRSKIGSIYASTRSSIRMKLHRGSGSLTRRTNPRLAVTFGSPTDVTATAQTGGGGAVHAPRTTSSLAASTAGSEDPQQQQPFLNPSAVDPQMPSTSTAPFPTGNNLRIPAQRGYTEKIIFERPEAQQLDVSQALVDLNADRNLFEQAHNPEMEGQFGQLVWANWRQIGATGNRPVVDEVDDEEDDAKEDKALICKTLKPGAGRVQFERFLRNALQFHHVPAHSHLSQVIAAATFGNFMNPESVKDLPLICYAHDGFGLLKMFLQTCRGQPIKEMDQISNYSISESGGVPMGRGGSASREGGPKESGGSGTSGGIVPRKYSHEKSPKNPRIVVTNTPSSALPETTLRTHDLCSMAIQIISAVRHLHKFGIIHKDIATRNCLVSRARLPQKFGSERLRLHVQLCDSALSRDFFPEDYALPPNSTNLEEAEPCPVRWMAPELLKNPPVDAQKRPVPNVFNSATDVWAYGVLMWELFTCGQQPYAEMHADEFAQAIVYAGLRLSQPYNCPDEVYAMMSLCWATEPEGRPTATELDHKLQEFMNRLRKYI